MTKSQRNDDDCLSCTLTNVRVGAVGQLATTMHTDGVGFLRQAVCFVDVGRNCRKSTGIAAQMPGAQAAFPRETLGVY
jgi:hypothetical protein